MISISFFGENQNKISICFTKENLLFKQRMLKLINDTLVKHEKTKYYISIRGIGSTIEKYLAKIKSNTYIFIDEFKYKFIVKTLPELHLITDDSDDLLAFGEFVEAFDEGEVLISILSTELSRTTEYVMDNKQSIIEYANKYSLLQITIHSDGDVFDVENCNGYHNLAHICNEISKAMLEKNNDA